MLLGDLLNKLIVSNKMQRDKANWLVRTGLDIDNRCNSICKILRFSTALPQSAQKGPSNISDTQLHIPITFLFRLCFAEFEKTLVHNVTWLHWVICRLRCGGGTVFDNLSGIMQLALTHSMLETWPCSLVWRTNMLFLYIYCSAKGNSKYDQTEQMESFLKTS